MRVTNYMVFILIFSAMAPFAYAQLYGGSNLASSPDLAESVQRFEEETGAALAVSMLNETDDITREAELYYNVSSADIMIVYDIKNNKIAIAKPLSKEVISDDKINSILDSRQDEKMLIADENDALDYVMNIINDLGSELSTKGVYGICSITKDGICDKNCLGDLDCECGNGICDYHENFMTCPKDCKKSADYGCAIMSDGYCDKNCPLADIDCTFSSFSERTFELAKKKRTAASVLQIVVGSLLFMMIAILIYILEKKKGFRRYQQ